MVTFTRTFSSSLCPLFFTFLPNNSTSKTMKNAFYFIKIAIFVLEIFKYLYFFPSFRHIPDSKGQMKGNNYDVMNWLASISGSDF